MKNTALPSVSSQLFCYGNGIDQVIAIPVHADTQLYQNTYGSNKSSLGMDANVEYQNGTDCHFYEEQNIDGSFYIPFQSSTNVYQLLQQPGPSSSLMTVERQDQPYSGAGGSRISNLTSVDANDIPHQQLLSFCNKISHSTESNNSNITDARTRKRLIISEGGLCNGDEKEGGCLIKKKRTLFSTEKEQYLDNVHEANKHQFMKETIQTQRKSVPVRRRSNKLNDKITALQKLVSPYGKTDTASVLQEASTSIKLLQHQIQNMWKKMNASHSNAKQDNFQNSASQAQRVALRDKGFCLVPVSLTQRFTEDEETRKRFDDSKVMIELQMQISERLKTTYFGVRNC